MQFKVYVYGAINQKYMRDAKNFLNKSNQMTKSQNFFLFLDHFLSRQRTFQHLMCVKTVFVYSAHVLQTKTIHYKSKVNFFSPIQLAIYQIP